MSGWKKNNLYFGFWVLWNQRLPIRFRATQRCWCLLSFGPNQHLKGLNQNGYLALPSPFISMNKEWYAPAPYTFRVGRIDWMGRVQVLIPGPKSGEHLRVFRHLLQREPTKHQVWVRISNCSPQSRRAIIG